MDALQVTQTIMDEYSARILLGTFDRPASAIELGRRFGLPTAACYRRIKELEGLGLVYGERGSLPGMGEGRSSIDLASGPSISRSRMESFEPASCSPRSASPRDPRTRSPSRS